MTTTFYVLEAPGEQQVLEWFRALPEAPHERGEGAFKLLHFRSIGDLTFDEGTGKIDGASSPIVTIFEPCVLRGALWTVCEVIFRTEHLRSRFPALARIQKRFKAWIESHSVVWDQRDDDGCSSGYYLEGGIKNVAERVYALPSGLAAYEQGRYFVAHRTNDAVLDRTCKMLRLRGVECD